jgi:hypothetical protein
MKFVKWSVMLRGKVTGAHYYYMIEHTARPDPRDLYYAARLRHIGEQSKDPFLEDASDWYDYKQVDF